jgi:dTDP-4-amino-4,6-dideoxy-D-galactose acyltransferase
VSKESSPLCEILPWDSEFFGFKIARVSKTTLTDFEAEAIDRWCDQSGVKCIYFATDTSDSDSARAAEGSGYRIVDVRMTFQASVGSGFRVPGSGSSQLATATESDIPQLQKIASDSYRITRFYADPNFDRARADALYVEWVTKSVHGYADAVLVVKDEENVLGFVSCHIKPEDKSGSIGLVGVSENARGKGIGKQVVFAALEWFAEHGCKSVTVVTQGRNIAAQRLYAACGFLPAKTELYFHKWYE